jgi:nucleoside-diphosphate-sugar epimerase
LKVLITGAQGYIGSVLGTYLEARGHQVSGVDVGFYAEPVFYADSGSQPAISPKDVRNLNAEDLSGFEAVIHLAGLSNDAVGELSPGLTQQINVGGALRTALAARNAGVARFINFSSCSIYGAIGEQPVDELSATQPLTEYARSKILAEEAINQLAGDSFTVVSMRNATLFGPSPRMRFDIVLNNLAGLAWTIGEIRMTSDGTPWRPLIHITDVARAAAIALDAPSNLVNREAFNVGDDALNYQVSEIACAISKRFPDCKVTLGRNGDDRRSYKVSFRKIREVLGFTCERDIEYGADELYNLFERVKLTRELFETPSYTRLRRIRELIDSGKVDKNLFWHVSSENEGEVAALAISA